MNRNLTSPSAGVTVVQGLKVYEGGTGAVDAAGALANLGAIPKAKINQANGVLGLSVLGKLDVNALPANSTAMIGLIGPTSMNKGTSASFTISNYDAFTTYVLETVGVGGTIFQNGDKISYTAPAAIGTYGFKINGRLWSINVTDYMPAKPTLTGVVMAGTQNHPYLVLTSSAFSMAGSADTHKNTDWQIATDSAFTSLVSQSLADPSNRTSFTGQPGNVNTTYYARVRYRSSGDFVSDWSDTFAVQTAANYLLNKEIQKIVPPDRGVNQTFGFVAAMSSDGTRLVVTGPYNFTGNVVPGAIYVFVRVGNTWALEAKVQNPAISVDDRFGYWCAIDQTGSRFVVCSYRDDYTISATSYTDAGSAFVYARTSSPSGNIWALEGTLRPSNPSTNFWFGVGCGMTADGSRVVVCAQQNGGGAYIFVRSGTVWTLEQQLIQGTAAPGTAFYGVACSISPDGARATVCDYNYDSSGGGALYVFVRNGNVWTQEQVLRALDPNSNARFGAAAVFDQTCTRLAIAARGDSAKGSGAGAIYVFTRTGSVWAQEAKLTASNGKAGDALGTVFMSLDGTRIAAGAITGGVLGNPLTTSGVVYMWTRSGVNWTQDNMITCSDATNTCQFGGSVTGSGSFDNIVVSAILIDGSGAVYSYSA